MNPTTVASIPLFGPVSRQKANEIASLADEVEVPAGTTLIREGEFAREFFVIVEGTAEVIRDGEVIAVLGPGEFFGEVGLLETIWRTATVVATSPMKLLVVAQLEFRSLLYSLPEAAERIEQAAAARA
jgi:CRP-like cAMP-binding protein